MRLARQDLQSQLTIGQTGLEALPGLDLGHCSDSPPPLIAEPSIAALEHHAMACARARGREQFGRVEVGPHRFAQRDHLLAR